MTSSFMTMDRRLAQAAECFEDAVGDANAVIGIQAAEQVLNMLTNRPVTDSQRFRDLFVHLALHN